MNRPYTGFSSIYGVGQRPMSSCPEKSMTRATVSAAAHKLMVRMDVPYR